ncbi:WbqC family protein [Actinocatenispora comari]|uniref:WbqC family protein n=1 Tax=Actinocatenispora comari TaxID=2807577 RepID=UPI001A919BBF|nr:WbqC family protein [Actinocatenispora comari]
MAIHQPNLLPRLSTLAKLAAADIWIVLDDVQFTARDYQHRARLAPPHTPDKPQWLTIPVHRPYGRATRITEVRIADHTIAERRLTLLSAQHYGRSPGWPDVRAIIAATLAELNISKWIAPVAEASSLALLTAVGWTGTIRHSSTIPASRQRNQRLVDLSAAVGAGTYLCGTGGARYLDPLAFHDANISVQFTQPPAGTHCRHAAMLSSIHHLADLGACGVAAGLGMTQRPRSAR